MKSKKYQINIIIALFLIMAILLIAKNPTNLISGKLIAEKNAVKWLLDQQKNNNWNNDIVDTSLVLMALDKQGLKNIDEINSAVEWIKKSKNEKQDCFPSYPCKIKDTVFAIHSLKLLDKENSKDLIDNAFEWLYKAQPTLTTGTYFIKVTADKPETFGCDIIITELNNTVDNFKLDNSTETLKQVYPSLRNFKISCKTNSTIKISLLQEGTTIKTSGNQAYFRLTNNCFPTDLSSKTCDADVTAYALWLLPELKDKIDISWLNNYRFEFPFRIAVLYSATKDRLYLNELKSMQKNGKWNDIYTTALISTLIDDKDLINNATAYINSQKNKICWSNPCTVSETAAVLLK